MKATSEWNNVQLTLIYFSPRDKARFLKHYRPFVYDTFIASLFDIDGFDDPSPQAEQEIEEWFSAYFDTTSADDLPAIHAIDQVREYNEQEAQAFADALADITFDGEPPEIDRGSKQPWER